MMLKKYKYKTKIFLALTILVSASWAKEYFDNLSFSQIFFHLFVPAEGTSSGIVLKYIYDCIPEILIFSFVFILLLNKLLTKNVTIKNIKININKFKKTFVNSFLIITLIYGLSVIGFFKFLYNNIVSSNFIDNNYVNPADVNITFNNKRNLIYIYLESMEYTYSDYGLTNELNKLKEINDNFNTNKGAYVIGNASWTTAAMFAQTSGLPLNVNFSYNTFNVKNNFLPGVTTLGDILKTNGYNNYVMAGSNFAFGGRRVLFETHGNYDIWDLDSALNDNKMKSTEKVFWGFDDSHLFSYAKDKLKEISTNKEPFNLTLLTVNTHNPDGYLEKSCKKRYNSQYQNVISCSSLQIEEFVSWIKKQDFYSNTTIILSGDHLSMNTSFLKELDKDYERTTYFTIINSDLKYHLNKNRLYTTYDIFPTTLASIGASIKGNRLGLGTNLYSENSTLLEKNGIEKFTKEISKRSNYYNNNFYKGK